MLSDNIRNYRKKNNLSQDELAEKVGVSRQSISFWENGQTQPTIENIITLAKIFNVSSDMLLGNTDNINTLHNEASKSKKTNKNHRGFLIFALVAVIAVIIGIIIFCVVLMSNYLGKKDPSNTSNSSIVQVDNSSLNSNTATPDSKPNKSETPKVENNKTNAASTNVSFDNSSTDETNSTISSNPPSNTSETTEEKFDLFTYCKDFAIKKGTLNGDYCIYQQPAAKYGGYENEYFSISYWGDSDMVEFCLHCPLDDTLSHNFYIRMRGGYNKKYEYLSSKYYRDNGESLRSATGYIDPAVFSKNYPISCDQYDGSLDGQDQFMEDTRIGVCDLIDCLKQFVTVEGMECDFSDFDFVNF